jgi:hypothetical protein
VPQLCNPSVQITLRGEASNTGAKAFNFDLACRRVFQVLDFLNQNGPVRANIVTEFPGADDAIDSGEIAKDENREDERFRAVRIMVENSRHRLVPILFDRPGGLGANDGFDDTADPPWVLLKFGALPRRMQVENAEGLSLVSRDEGIAKPEDPVDPRPGPVRITEQVQVFQIKGHLPGTTEIRVVDRQRLPHAKLAVSVLPTLKVSCAFHYVRNHNYGTSTQIRHRGDEVDFVDELNGIWRPQANIEFVQVPGNRSEPDLEMHDKVGNVDMGNVIDTDAKFNAIGSDRNRDPNAQFNVFFVREVNMPGKSGDSADAITRVPSGDCFFEDNIGSEGEQTCIAHEAGHCLTLKHDKPIPTTNQMLMHAPATAHFLPRAHVELARSKVRGQ